MMLSEPELEILQVGPPGKGSTAENSAISERAALPFSALILAVLSPTILFTVEVKLENKLEIL